MREVTGWPTSTDVTEPIVRVSHGGKDREVRSLSLSRTLPSSFHAQAVGMGGIPQATGNITWAAVDDVVAGQPTAFNRVNGWPPKTRDPVNVWLGYRTASGDALAKTLTGFIKSNQGDPAADVSSSVVDRISRLDRKVTLPPLLRTMPPLTDGGPWRGVDLYPTFFTDLAARAGGFYSTPPLSAGCVFSAPLMGSTWPERGTLFTGLRYTDRNNASAVWGVTPWGLGISNAYLSYTPSGNSTLDRPMEITLMGTPGRNGTGSISVVWGNASIRLSIIGSVVSADVIDGSTRNNAVYMTGATDEVYTLRVTPVGGTLEIVVRTSGGRELTGAAPRPGGIVGGATEVRVESHVATAVIGGAQVSFPDAAYPWVAVNYVRSAFITPAAHNASLIASPSIIAESAKSLLEEQSKAELAAWWIDGEGALHWRNRNALVSGAPVMDLTSRDHLKSLQWEEDFAGVASSVEVTGREATVQQSKLSVIPLWESAHSGADPGESLEWIIHPDADSDWIMVERTVKSLHQTDLNGFNRFNRGEGSWIALYAENDATKINAWAAAIASCTFIDHRTYKVAAFVSGYTDNNGWEFSLKVPSEDAAGGASGPMRKQPGLSTPTIRGFAKTDWTDSRRTAIAAGGMDAPVLTHDVGWWVQEPAAVQAIANLLASQTNTPRPVLTGVSLVPDSRLELGDVVTLTDPDLTGTRYVCLTTGIDQSMQSNPTTWTMSADFRILSTSSL